MPLLSLSLLTGGPKLGGVQAQSNNGRADTMGRTHKVCSATRHTTLRSCGATLEAVVGDALLLMLPVVGVGFRVMFVLMDALKDLATNCPRAKFHDK